MAKAQNTGAVFGGWEATPQFEDSTIVGGDLAWERSLFGILIRVKDRPTVWWTGLPGQEPEKRGVHKAADFKKET